MRIEAAYEQLKRANPEPDPVALRHDLETLPPSLRSENVDTSTPSTTTQIPNIPSPRKSRRWAPALTAGVVVLIVLLLVPWNNGRSVLDFSRPSPVDIANQYIEARNAYDSETARTLLADDVILFDEPIMSLEELELGFEALRAYEFQFEPFECEETRSGPRSGPTAFVHCTYLMDTKPSQIVGYPPVEGSFQFGIEGGLITSLAHLFNFDKAPDGFDEFLVWLAENHRADSVRGALRQLFREGGGGLSPILTRESLDLVVAYLEEWDRAVNG